MKLYHSNHNNWVKNTRVKLQSGDMIYACDGQKYGHAINYWLILSGKQFESKSVGYPKRFACQFKGQALYVGNHGQEIHLQNVYLTVNHLILYAAKQ